ncbi:hypothetical protein ASC64_18835 [Nocardioides sp. Root122]|uniref:hypothetical protein n=1 Tax=Nocardioides TaxID=1839 RepID=UPI000702D769|nr:MULTISPECIES: hypothetical protein [Nocardioides]KQV73493.1 hypothetical protein ASC64_18835 [Nocardioides sp. Root122]MCK9825245.1 hypothetical protein [Nocardioides cavernae]
MTTDLVPVTGRGGDLTTAGCGCDDHHLGHDALHALERNLFFPRKLMEVRHWQAEQSYHRHARELVTRLGLGSGVLCGLEVRLTTSGSVVISPGVGVDGHGRIVVVPRSVEVDPARPTDACGRPAGDPLDEGFTTVALCYHECGTDPVCMPPEGCDDEPRVVPSMVREAYAVSVTVGAGLRVGLPDGLCEQVFGCDECEATSGEDPGSEATFPHDAEGRREVLDRLAPRRCACGEPCIPLATVALGEERALDTGVRTVIRSNRELLDLLLCLADRVDECCSRLPTAVPPRITGLWPWPDDEGAALDELLETGRLEIAADRDLAEQGLDDPDPWLGVWLLDRRRVSRLRLRRAAGALTHVAVPPGGDGAAYDVDVREAKPTSRSLVLVMVRSTAPGPVRAAASDQLALDPDLEGTRLTEEDRDALWAMAPASHDSGLGAVVAAAANPPPLPTLPSGDGTAGGELHVALLRPSKVAPPPRLLAVWPEGAAELGEDRDPFEWKTFLEEPQLQLTVSRALTTEATDRPREWLRAWHGTEDGPFLYGIEELELMPGTATDLPGGEVRYAFRIQPPRWFGRDTIVVQLRSTPPVVTESPIGRDDPTVLLDADVAGTALGSQDLFRLWSGDPFNGLPALPLTATGGQQLYDGTEGGLAHWAFTVTRP